MPLPLPLPTSISRGHIKDRHCKKTKESRQFKEGKTAQEHPSQFHLYIHPFLLLQHIFNENTTPHCVHTQGQRKVYCFELPYSIGVAPHLLGVPRCYFLRVIVQNGRYIISAFPTFLCYMEENRYSFMEVFDCPKEEEESTLNYFKRKIWRFYKTITSFLLTKYVTFCSVLSTKWNYWWNYRVYNFRENCLNKYRCWKEYYFPSPPMPEYWD